MSTPDASNAQSTSPECLPPYDELQQAVGAGDADAARAAWCTFSDADRDRLKQDVPLLQLFVGLLGATDEHRRTRRGPLVALHRVVPAGPDPAAAGTAGPSGRGVDGPLEFERATLDREAAGWR